MKISKSAVNQTTNILGGIVGVPQIVQGIPMIAAGDYVGGGILVAQGIALLIGFYFIGKGENGVTPA